MVLTHRKASMALYRATVKQLSRTASVNAKILLSSGNFCFVFLVKFRANCQDRQAKESAVAEVSFQENNIMAQLDFKQRPCPSCSSSIPALLTT